MTSTGNYTLTTIGFINSLYTFLIFSASCLSFAFLATFYTLVKIIRDTWLRHLERKFPDLEFVREGSLRSAVDTHRNMGIMTILISVNGNCDPVLIKERLMEDLLNKRKNNGQYVHRHLRMTLTTKWGWYAWQRAENFNIDQHLVFATPHYRGRPISDANIQECVSETVSKYLVNDLPPWQITVYQLLSVEKYYLLIRFHHMLFTHEGMDLGSLLTLSKNRNEVIPTKSELDEDNLFATYNNNARRSNPFQELYKTPKALPLLYQQICETCTNAWNEFVSVYDPTENPSILKKPGLRTTLAVFVIVLVAVLREIVTNPRRSFKLMGKALAEKGVTWSFVVRSLWNTLNPLSLVRSIIKVCVRVVVFPVKFPLILLTELYTLYVTNSRDPSPLATYLSVLVSIWTILKDSMKETLYYCKMIYAAPRLILEEFLLANKYSRNHLQFVSLCGRKVVSWSDPVPLEKIREIQDVTGASPSEILITATSASLRDLLVQYSLDIPDTVITTARYYSQEQLIQSRKNGCPPCGSGILCLPLPIRNPFGSEYDPVVELRAVQQIVLRARLRQPALYLASLSQLQYGLLTQVLPSPVLRLVLNVLSRRFPVLLSEVSPSEIGENGKCYLWGQEVEELMYWKPPQANICMSLTLMTFGGYVRLGVIADALLSPHHTVITSTFAQHLWELAAAAGVTTNFRNYSVLSEDSDSLGGSRSSGRNSTLSSSSLDLDMDSKNYSDDENNLNQDSSQNKYPLRKKLQFNIPC